MKAQELIGQICEASTNESADFVLKHLLRGTNLEVTYSTSPMEDSIQITPRGEDYPYVDWNLSHSGNVDLVRDDDSRERIGKVRRGMSDTTAAEMVAKLARRYLR